MSKNIKLEAHNPTELRILTYLQDNASDALVDKINKDKKTIAEALDYAASRARQDNPSARCACVDDAVVFGWITHFFENDEQPAPIRAPQKKQPTQTNVFGLPEDDQTDDDADDADTDEESADDSAETPSLFDLEA